MSTIIIVRESGDGAIATKKRLLSIRNHEWKLITENTISREAENNHAKVNVLGMATFKVSMFMLFKMTSKWTFPVRFAPSVVLLLAMAACAQTGTITGQVFCADTQKPARFAAVLLPRLGTRAYTQVDGTFVLKNVPAGNQELEIQYPGYVETDNWQDIKKHADADTIRNLKNIEYRVTVTPGRTTNAIVTIFRGAELGGTITYDDGSPAPGFDVKATYVITPLGSASSINAPANVSLGPDISATTDSHGRFQITGLLDGTYIVSTRNGERFAPFSIYFGNTVEASKATQVTVKGGEVRSDLDIQIDLNSLHQVRGVLMTVDHQPVGKASVQLNFADDTDNEEVRLTTTSEDGSFVFLTVPDGKFVLQGGASKSKIAATPIVVSGQDITDIILTAKP
jgi:CarboxypepD_reg-like domain